MLVGSERLTAGLDDFKGIFQAKRFYDSVLKASGTKKRLVALSSSSLGEAVESKPRALQLISKTEQPRVDHCWWDPARKSFPSSRTLTLPPRSCSTRIGTYKPKRKSHSLSALSVFETDNTHSELPHEKAAVPKTEVDTFNTTTPSVTHVIHGHKPVRAGPSAAPHRPVTAGSKSPRLAGGLYHLDEGGLGRARGAWSFRSRRHRFALPGCPSSWRQPLDPDAWQRFQPRPFAEPAARPGPPFPAEWLRPGAAGLAGQVPGKMAFPGQPVPGGGFYQGGVSGGRRR